MSKETDEFADVSLALCIAELGAGAGTKEISRAAMKALLAKMRPHYRAEMRKPGVPNKFRVFRKSCGRFYG